MQRQTKVQQFRHRPAAAGLVLAGLLGVALEAAGPGPAWGGEARGLVRIDGSSTVYPITEAVAEEFQTAKRGAVRVTVGISGTGGGFKKFCRGETDVSNASRPILADEMAACRKSGVRYIELPVAFDAITVVVNPRNDWVRAMTIADLKKIWEPAAQGTVTRWNQVRPEWPDAPLTLYGPGADSGTFDYFTEAVVGKAKASRGDYTASEDDNVLVQGVSTDRYALGYFGFAYYEANRTRLKAVPIDGGRGPVAPSPETVLNGRYHPLARPVFIYVSTRAAERPEVRAFVQFYLEKGGELARQVGYIPLTPKAYALARERFERREAGTAFGGTPEVGLPVEELLRRPPRS
ncbi:MAG TPA: PstS family phosphate ABC transporter substrate-binding protein [Thermodesulfobacteriota bacterium]|nr:PstS family phosphate ABC transporter substrate-binding protein [Thermodesulfobacteriota bacterium]